MRLPDGRYTANLELTGPAAPQWVARFCGERLRDSHLWPVCIGGQAPGYETRTDAIAACRRYETERQVLLATGQTQQANAAFYQD